MKIKEYLLAFGLGLATIFGCNHIPEKQPNMFFDNVPLLTNTLSTGDSQSHISSHDVALAIAIFYIEWNTQFGDPDGKVLKNLNNLTVLWTSEMQEEDNVYDMNGKFYPHSKVIGLTYTPNFVWVWSNDKKISHTSLAHELVHVSLWSLNGATGDVDHEGSKETLWTAEHTKFIGHVNSVFEKNDL